MLLNAKPNSARSLPNVTSPADIELAYLMNLDSKQSTDPLVIGRAA